MESVCTFNVGLRMRVYNISLTRQSSLPLHTRVMTWNCSMKRSGISLRPWQTRTNSCGHIVADTDVSPFARGRNICCGHKFCVRGTKNVSDFVQKHSVSATNVSQFAQPKKHHGQQCVCNNVSSFTRTLNYCVGGYEPMPVKIKQNWNFVARAEFFFSLIFCSSVAIGEYLHVM